VQLTVAYVEINTQLAAWLEAAGSSLRVGHREQYATRHWPSNYLPAHSAADPGTTAVTTASNQRINLFHAQVAYVPRSDQIDIQEMGTACRPEIHGKPVAAFGAFPAPS
jgi:hypothetical protein